MCLGVTALRYWLRMLSLESRRGTVQCTVCTESQACPFVWSVVAGYPTSLKELTCLDTFVNFSHKGLSFFAYRQLFQKPAISKKALAMLTWKLCNAITHLTLTPAPPPPYFVKGSVNNIFYFKRQDFMTLSILCSYLATMQYWAKVFLLSNLSHNHCRILSPSEDWRNLSCLINLPFARRKCFTMK